MAGNFAPWNDVVTPSETVRMADLAIRLESEGRDVIHLETADPDFPTPEHVRAAAVDALDAGETGYPPTDGLFDLRAAIAEKLTAENGIETDPEDVIVTPGSKFAVFEAIHSLVGEGDEAVVMEPAWTSYVPMVEIAGATPRTIRADPENGFKPTAEQLEAAVSDDTQLLVLNTPSNPTGAVFSKAELELIRDFAVEYDFRVVSDEVYGKIVFDREHHSIASLPGMAERTVTVNGFSKSHAMAGWRIGYLTGPDDAMAAAGTLQSHSVTSATSFAQRGAIAALEGDQDPFERMYEAYERRRDVLVDCLRDAGVEFPAPEGGMNAFVPVGGDDVAISEAVLEREGVAMTPGSPFGGEGYVRICLTTGEDRIREGIERLLDHVDV